MADVKTGDVCRLVVVGPTSQVDLSVPVHVPIADLMPALLRGLGTDLADRGLEHSGWIVQRLGEPPLDEDATTEDLELVDGDVLHLRPRSEQIPPLDFDDLVDGVASGIGARSGIWRSTTTRAVSLASLIFWLATTLVVPPLAETVIEGAAVALGAAFVMLTSATIWGRFGHDRSGERFLVAGSMAFAAEAGFLGGHWIAPPGPGAGSIWLLAATVLAVGVGVVALGLTGDRGLLGPPTVSTLVLAGTVVLAAFLASPGGLTWVQVSGVMLLGLIALRPWIPLLSFKLAGMSLPELPVEPDDLQVDIDPEPGKELLDRTALADRHMTGLNVVAGLVSGASLLTIALEPGRMALVLVALAVLNQLLTLRPMTSAWHRYALGIPATAVLAVALVAAAWELSLAGLIGTTAATLVLALSGAIAAETLPRRRMTPIWGRIGDWTQTLSVVAMVPIVLWFLGAFALVRRVVG